MTTYRKLEDLVVYQKLCRLHIEIAELTHRWPASSVGEADTDYIASPSRFPDS